ncbi:hypothetical protein B4P00_01585 [Shewanella xiamenensis]|nr:hypothetical protein [Shewanella xiamenensis]
MGDPFDSTECVMPLKEWDNRMAANIPQLCFGVIVGLRLLDRDNVKRRMGKKMRTLRCAKIHKQMVDSWVRVRDSQLQRYNKKPLI